MNPNYQHDDRTGRLDWMQTHTGRAYFLAEPRASDIDILDIAHALSNICRYGGHTPFFYSVAEHSVLVSCEVPREHALSALLHDAPEAYVGDIPRPLKRLLGDAYARLEERAWHAVADRFGLPHDMDRSIKHADNAVLLAERDQLMREPPIPWGEWTRQYEPAKCQVRCLAPRDARSWFLSRFHDLTVKVRA